MFVVERVLPIFKGNKILKAFLGHCLGRFFKFNEDYRKNLKLE